jgi:hypothetical protein
VDVKKLFAMLAIYGVAVLISSCKRPEQRTSGQLLAQAVKGATTQIATPKPCRRFNPDTDADNSDMKKEYLITVEGYPRDYTLKEAVDHFNEVARCIPVGKTQPPLTEMEILTAVLSIPGSDPEPYEIERKYLKEVFEKKILPKGSLLQATTGFQNVGKYTVHYWQISLRFDLHLYPDAPSMPGKPDPRNWFLIRLQYVSFEMDRSTPQKF